MLNRKAWLVSGILVLLVAAFSSACATESQVPPSTDETRNDLPLSAPEQKPEISKVSIAFLFTGPLDEPWAQSMYQAVQRVKQGNPRGLVVEDRWFENIPIDDYEKFIRDVILSNMYDMIWIHDASAGADKVDNLRSEFPDVLFPITASNYHPVGGNAYWIQAYAHEPAYLSGVLAGLLTETDSIGMVSAFPFASVNHLLNSFRDGAKSVNPNVKFRNAFIESWWDPVKAKETALAQIEAGADIIYAERYGAHEAARDKGILAFGSQSDINHLAPETIITSPLMFWDPSIKYMIDVWYDHEMNGTAYNAPDDKPVYFLMKDGGSGIAPFYGFENELPPDVMQKFNEVKQQILDGTLVIELKLDSIPLD